MTVFQDMSTRKLKRALRTATKTVWFFQRAHRESPNSALLRDLTRARSAKARIVEELRRRGWDA